MNEQQARQGRQEQETSAVALAGEGVKYPDVDVQLSGRDGNAGTVMGAVSSALQRADVSREEIDQFRAEAMSGDYDHLLQTCMRWVSVS